MLFGNFKCVKTSLYSLNFIYILIGFLLIITAAYARLAAIVTSIGICTGIIFCGVLLIIISSLGIYATLKHNQIALFFYIVILFLLFLVQFAVACACLAVNESMQKYIVSKGWNASESGKSDLMKSFDCCGLFSVEYFNNSKNICGKLQCCQGEIASKSSCCVGGANRYDCPCSHCWDKLYHNLNPAIKVTGGIGLFFSFTEIIGVWLAVKYRNIRDPQVDPKSFL